jgi:6-pyruvoyltetrahydropterin/6-carboxytetrahydropterin synthase
MGTWKLVSEFRFDSAHVIEDYDGPCGRMHGHTYKVKMELTASKLRSSAHLRRPIMVADFRTLKWAKKDVDQGGLDHMVLNDVKALGGDTTAEKLAEYIHSQTMIRVRSTLESDDAGADLQLKVTVWETPDSYCEYWE